MYCFCRGQDTTLNLSNFLLLIDKVKNDNTLSGTFIYKGYQVNISENATYKTVIGKFKEIQWTNTKSTRGPTFTAIYHNKLGYMTRSLFHTYIRQLGSDYKDFKITKEKYCKKQWCRELLTKYDLPILLVYNRKENEIPEIK